MKSWRLHRRAYGPYTLWTWTDPQGIIRHTRFTAPYGWISVEERTDLIGKPFSTLRGEGMKIFHSRAIDEQLSKGWLLR